MLAKAMRDVNHFTNDKSIFGIDFAELATKIN